MNSARFFTKKQLTLKNKMRTGFQIKMEIQVAEMHIISYAKKVTNNKDDRYDPVDLMNLERWVKKLESLEHEMISTYGGSLEEEQEFLKEQQEAIEWFRSQR